MLRRLADRWMGWPSWGRIASAVVAAVLVTAPFVSPEEESPSASSPTVTSSTSTVETPPMTTGADTPVVSTQPIPATTSADTTSQDDADAETTTTQTAPPDTDLADVVTVTAIIDGDTFDVTTAAGDPERVRLFGVNTPETGECLSDEATDLLTELLTDASVTLETDRTDRDRYGRLLRYVFADGIFVNSELARQGLALARSVEPDTARSSELAEAQLEAQRERRPIWAPDACGPASPVSLEITDVAYDPPGDDGQDLNGEWIRIRNTGLDDADLGGWTVRDESSSNRYRFAAGTAIRAGGSIVLHTGCGTDTDTRFFWCKSGSAVWSNTGDTVLLQDTNGSTSAFYSYDRGASSSPPTTIDPNTATSTSTTSTLAPAGGRVTIGGAQFDAPGNDNENKNGEWIQVTNSGTESAELSGWRIEDEGPNHTYRFPNGTLIPAGATITLYTGCGPDSATELYWCVSGSAVWNNSGDTAHLIDPNGTIVSTR